MTRIERLTEWVRKKHEGQIIQCTNEPYFEHLKFVAEMAADFATFGYEVGISHDLLEKTITTAHELYGILINFGYNNDEAASIQDQVIELTDIFTMIAYPDLPKNVRKQMEAERLIKISPEAQTVKYCDLIYNTNWVLKYKPETAGKYIKKKLALLAKMNQGNAELYYSLIHILNNGLRNSKGKY
jgi:hypothetical protein